MPIGNNRGEYARQGVQLNGGHRGGGYQGGGNHWTQHHRSPYSWQAPEGRVKRRVIGINHPEYSPPRLFLVGPLTLEQVERQIKHDLQWDKYIGPPVPPPENPEWTHGLEKHPHYHCKTSERAYPDWMDLQTLLDSIKAPTPKEAAQSRVEFCQSLADMVNRSAEANMTTRDFAVRYGFQVDSLFAAILSFSAHAATLGEAPLPLPRANLGLWIPEPAPTPAPTPATSPESLRLPAEAAEFSPVVKCNCLWCVEDMPQICVQKRATITQGSSVISQFALESLWTAPS